MVIVLQLTFNEMPDCSCHGRIFRSRGLYVQPEVVLLQRVYSGVPKCGNQRLILPEFREVYKQRLNSCGSEKYQHIIIDIFQIGQIRGNRSIKYRLAEGNVVFS